MKLSYSSISTYETCPAKYKFQYQDRLPTTGSPALSFGDVLHRTLYRFHDRPVPVAPSLEEMFEANAGSFRIPAALEFRFTVEIEGVQLSGMIDRMDRIPGGGYEIIDYKTNRRLPPKAVVDRDLQLSLYYLAAREVWGIEPDRLTLYFLLPGQRMSTFRTEANADELRRRIATVAERIAAGKFDPRQNPLCEWCDFQPVCPLYRHKFEKEKGDPAPKMTELVDEWVALKREDWERYRRLEELRGLINAFCEEHGYRRLFGSDGSAVDRRPVHVTEPNTEMVRGILEPMGLWDQVISVDPKKLSSLIETRSLPPDVEDALLASREEVRTQYSLYLKDPARARR
jgi:putative RecB family exonuclease